MENNRHMVSKDLKYKGKKILIMGLGINGGGLGSAKFFAHSEADVRVTDMMNEEFLKTALDQLVEFNNIEYFLSGYRHEDIDWADIIIKNPGVLPNNEFLLYAIKKGKQIETDVSLFLQYVDRKKVIGITGTKGKSTTATLTTHILKKVLGEDKVLLAGNIGKSMLDVIPYVNNDEVVILELSSFQLMIFAQNTLSIHRAAITNIYPDHLNYHGTMDEYIKAKRLIAAYQQEGDLLFLRKGDEITTSDEFISGLKAEIQYSEKSDLSSEQIHKLPEILQVEHNLENFAQAAKIAESFGVGIDDAIHAVADFQGVEFRQQLIKTWKGIKIYNDTTATMPDAAILAVRTHPNCILIAGGMDKGLPYKSLAEALDRYPHSIYFIDGSATDRMIELMKNKEKIKGTWDNFEEILKTIKNEIATDSEVYKTSSPRNDVIANEVKQSQIIIFSPGGTSFNHFQNEFDRGRKFNDAVEKVFS